jgi:predicted DNA binding CopG/RHH family protein
MKKKSGIDPAYYENNCFADDFIEAEKRGDLITSHNGESALEAIGRHFAQKRKQKEKTPVSMRLPTYVVSEAKAQAKKAGVSYTSYMQAILETTIIKPFPQTKVRAAK